MLGIAILDLSLILRFAIWDAAERPALQARGLISTQMSVSCEVAFESSREDSKIPALVYSQT